MIGAGDVTVIERSISQKLHAGLYADWNLRAAHLVRLNSGVQDFVAPSVVYSLGVSFPVVGFNTSFQLARGTQHPGMYIAADSGGQVDVNMYLRLVDIDLDWYRGSNRAISVVTQWRAVPDPNTWIWDEDFSLVGEQTTLDVDGNPIDVCGKLQAVDARFAEQTLKGIRRYVDPAQGDIAAVARNFRNRINSALFFGQPAGYWLCPGPRITQVDDVHQDIEVTFIGRDKGWNPVFPCPGQTGQPTGAEVEVTLHREADFNLLLTV